MLKLISNEWTDFNVQDDFEIQSDFKLNACRSFSFEIFLYLIQSLSFFLSLFFFCLLINVFVSFIFLSYILSPSLLDEVILGLKRFTERKQKSGKIFLKLKQAWNENFSWKKKISIGHWPNVVFRLSSYKTKKYNFIAQDILIIFIETDSYALQVPK